MPHSSREPSLFWPLLLVSASVALFLGWQVTVAVQQRLYLRQVAGQQALLAGQAAQVEESFKTMMTDLIKLAATDAEAQAIVSKYRISINPPSPSGLPGGADSAGGKTPP
jgi:hypothetical protein